MLLDEDPATLIHECTSNFHTTSDRDALQRISSLLSTLATSRTHRLSQQTASLKKLSRRHHTLSQTHELSLSQVDPASHAEDILRLDGTKFRIAKEASDAEIEGERLDGEWRRAVSVLESLEKAGHNSGGGGGGGESEEEERRKEAEREMLKLKVYRSLGVEVELDREGVWRRTVVRNMEEGTVDVVDVGEGGGREGYAGRVWGCL